MLLWSKNKVIKFVWQKNRRFWFFAPKTLEMLGIAKRIDGDIQSFELLYKSSLILRAINTGHFRVSPDYFNLFIANFKK